MVKTPPKKGYKVKPTKRQLKTMEIIHNNPGIAVSRAMEEAGYSKATAKTPQNLTQAKAFRQLANQAGVTLEQYFTNLGGAMQADKMNQFTGEITPDWSTRLNANKQAEKFLGFAPSQAELKNKLLDISSEADELEILNVVFKKSPPEVKPL